MANKTAADLEPLIRLRDWDVDECRRMLVALQTREDQLVLHGEELVRQMARESQLVAANPTTTGFLFGAFAADHKIRREKLATMLVDLRAEIEKAREQLMDAFRAREVVEQVKETRLEKERIEEARQEQIQLDEIAQTQYRQRRIQDARKDER